LIATVVAVVLASMTPKWNGCETALGLGPLWLILAATLLLTVITCLAASWRNLVRSHRTRIAAVTVMSLRALSIVALGMAFVDEGCS
jgi:hypothetical protein